MKLLLSAILAIFLGLACRGAPVRESGPEILPLPASDEAEGKSLEERVLLRGLEVLGRDLPPLVSVRFYYRDPPNSNARGSTHWRPGRAMLLYVKPTAGSQYVLDVLIHEWAHVRTLPLNRPDMHDAVWGVAYAEAYSAIQRAAEAGEFSDLSN